MDIDPCKLRYKFINCSQNVLNNCNLHDIIDCAKTGKNPEDPHWANSIKCIINNISVEDWKEEAQSKSSLADYVTIKENLCMESYLSDKTDFYGASLKFKIRSNTLPLDHKIKKWTPGIDGTCTLCNNGSEDVKHFLFLCQKLSKLRSEEYTKLERNLFEMNRIDVWELFMGGSTDMKFKLALGSASSTFLNLCNVIDIFDVFDRFCKSFAKRAWKLRSELKSNFIYM